MNQLEHFWDNLLSRSPSRIRSVFDNIDEASQQEVLTHLKRMVTEEGWHPEQAASAKAALDALADRVDNEDET